MTKNILIFVETENNFIAKVSLEIIAYAAQHFEKYQINAIILTTEEFKDDLINQLQNKGLDALYISVSDKFEDYAPSAYTTTLSLFLKSYHQDVFLIGATPMGRELAPRVAARNDLGLTADCTEIDLTEDDELLATRPTYGGELMATIISKTKPNFATIRPGALKTDNIYFEKNTKIEYFNPELHSVIEAIKVLKREKKQFTNGLEQAQIIVAGGLGLKTKENFDMIYKFAEQIGAKPAASRAAVEMGWAPKEIQVGQTGHTVSPKLYIAFGISGSMQHLVGISKADKIIAINNDKTAPIFKNADIGIVTSAPEFLKNLIKKSA